MIQKQIQGFRELQLQQMKIFPLQIQNTHLQGKYKNTINRCICLQKQIHSSDSGWKGVAVIPDICHFFYTHTSSGLKILHSKVRKFATKQRKSILGSKIHIYIHSECKVTQCV